MKLNRIMIASPKSGSGKTSITCALLQAFKDEGKKLISYKCGPDYIDPMFHQKIIGISSRNLDTFFTDDKTSLSLFLKNSKSYDLAILEGVMGLFDGLGGIKKEGSSYHLASISKTPIVLVVDAKGMGLSIVALIAGFLKYDKNKLIRGVILNRMSKSYFSTIKDIIEKELEIKVLGYLPDSKDFYISNRKLGLLMPDEIGDLEEQVKKFSNILKETVSLKSLYEISESAENLYIDKQAKNKKIENKKDRPIISVAKDEAFCFYYEDNLSLLKEYGAKIEFFSPLHDKKVAHGTCGILLGGGYPDLYAKELSKNLPMLSQIKNLAEDGMPIVAEAGGFMYLHSNIIDKDKNPYPMAAVFAGKTYYTDKLVRFGYIEVKGVDGNFLAKGATIKGHEFHYFDSEDNGNSCLSIKPISKKSYPSIKASENIFAGFPQLYYPSNPNFPKNFVKKAIEYKLRKDL